MYIFLNTHINVHTHTYNNPINLFLWRTLIQHAKIKVNKYKNTGKLLKRRFGTDSRGRKNSDVRTNLCRSH